MELHLTHTILATLAMLGAVVPTQDDRERRETPGQEEQQSSGVFLYRAKDVIGADVRGRTDDIGEIKDLLIEGHSGDIRYAVISVGGFLGLGDKLAAVPWSALMKRSGEDANELEFALEVTKEQLESAPDFDEDHLPGLGQAWEQRVHDHYGMQLRRADGEPGSTVSTPLFVRASKLEGADVRSGESATDARDGEEGEDLGHISMLALDPTEGRVSYGLVETDEIEQLPDRQVALPWNMFRVTFVDGDLKVTAPSVTKSKLASAPNCERDDWTTMCNPLWVREVYGFWGVEPYWARSVEAGYQRPSIKTGEGEQRSGGR